MRRSLALLAGISLIVSGLAATTTTARAEPPADPPTGSAVNTLAISDDLTTPEEEKRRALREQAIADVLQGKREVEERNGSSIVNMSAPDASGDDEQYVELARERTDRVFVILAEFGDERHPDYPDQDTDPNTPGPVRFDGPLHNQIPEPDRSKDNSTIWQPDFNQEHYEDLYFDEGKDEDGKDIESVKTFYEKSSSGRFTINGQVTDWVKVNYNQARYGRSNGYPCPGNVCANAQELIKDAVDAWVTSQKAKGRTDEQIKADMAEFDVWDRFDYDNDGDFNEPDGYIDHFQIVHAGQSQADGDPVYGEDALWSHRWAAFRYDRTYGEGPENNQLGGVQIGNTGLWISDYTMQSENGGLSVFTHEYAHDLGLPDLYNRQPGGTENGVNWWSMMAQNRVRDKDDVGIGTRAQDLGAWEKLQLGWLDYEIVPAGKTRTIDLGPHVYNTNKPQAVVSVLPDKKVTVQLPKPAQGTKQWWSGTGDDLDNTMTRTVNVPPREAKLTFKANYDIEQETADKPFDLATVEVNDGSGWKAIAGNITKGPNNEIFGSSNGWVDASFDMSAYGAKKVELRLRYRTDGGDAGNDDNPGNDGLFVDLLQLSGKNGRPPLRDDAESGPGDWKLDGFSIVGESVTNEYDNFYIASNRSYTSYDKYLQYGPYHFGYGPTLPDKVDFFPYQPGLLVSYWDTSQSDNSTSMHPGEGLILPIDANQNPIYNMEGEAWRPRIQGYDATFSLRKSDSFTLHVNGKPSYVRGQKAQPLFDDTRSYWREELPTAGVKTPGVGVTMRVLSQDGASMKVRVGSKAPRAEGTR